LTTTPVVKLADKAISVERGTKEGIAYYGDPAKEGEFEK